MELNKSESISIQEDETMQYLPDDNILVHDDGEEEIVEYSLFDQIKDNPTQTLLEASKTYTYSIHTLLLIANAHKKRLSPNKDIVLSTLAYLNKNNGICDGPVSQGLDFMCPCKEFRETKICPKKLFI